MNSKYFILILAALFLVGCKTSKQLIGPGFQNELFSIYNVKNCKEVHSGDAVDSQIGEIYCKEISFTYDYGRYGQRVPMTPAETFREAFDNYHYSKFFELTHIDTKVQSIFKDSVAIKALHKGQSDAIKPMFDCNVCNAVAEIEFKDRTWYFPATVSKQIFDKDIGDATNVTKGKQQTRVFTNDADILSGAAYWLPYRRHRDFLAIAVKESSLPKEEQRKILHSILLAEKK